MPSSSPHWHRIAVGLVVVGVGITLVPKWFAGSGQRSFPTALLAAPAELLQAVAPAGEGTQFWVVAGGGAPAYNEIALEKNVLYFQRTLETLGHQPEEAQVLFANGHDGQATVRYLDSQDEERYKIPEIPHLLGAATLENVLSLMSTGQDPMVAKVADPADCPIFYYFTGHGYLNGENPDNNAMILWQEDLLSVKAFTEQLDTLPPEQPFVTMMAQCYSGSFANLIYEGGDPENPVALQTRCGFFATVKTRPSVGCTALVNEADYEDYSSSFFAGLSGRDRIGNPAPSADYDGNGTVSFAEAHAFAKVDAHTPDWPISTSESWLQRQATPADEDRILNQALQTWMGEAQPEQRFVVEALARQLGFSLQRSFRDNLTQLPAELDEYQQAQLIRLQMQVIALGMAAQVRASGSPEAVAILEKLLNCEAGSWQ